jgi:hypothetical protein
MSSSNVQLHCLHWRSIVTDKQDSTERRIVSVDEQKNQEGSPMDTTTPVQSRFIVAAAVMIALVVGTMLLPATRGQAAEPSQADTTPPSIAVSDIFVTTTSEEGAVVNYRSQISLSDNSDPTPALSCAPTWGSFFVLGKTMVSCTATDAANNSAQASFRVLVARGDDADVALRQIFISPSVPQAGNIATLTFDVNNSQLSAARSLRLAIDLPPEATLLSAPSGCDTSALPQVSCLVGNLAPRESRSFNLMVEINREAIGTMIVNAGVSLGDNQRDIDPDNNSLSLSSPISPAADLTGLIVYVPMVFK